VPALLGAGWLGQYLSVHSENAAHRILYFCDSWTKTLFLGGLAACLPPLILSEIYRNVRQNQKEAAMPLKASFFFFLTTLSAITCGFLAARLSFAGSGIELVARKAQGASQGGGHWLPWSNNLVGCVLSAVVFAFILSRHAEEAAKAFDVAAQYVSKWSLWWLNFMLRFIAPAVFIMISAAIARTEGGILELVGPLGRIFGGTLLGLFFHVTVLVAVLSIVLGAPRVLRYLWHMKGALLFVWVIRSSVGGLTRTIPAARSFGIKEKYTNFVLPFGATVNMDGTSVYLTVAAVAFTVALGLPVGWGVFVALIMSILTASVGTAAAPSASLVLMNVVFVAAAKSAGTELTSDQMVSMVAAMIALLMSIDPILDMFRTVVNVCGDSLCCLFLSDTDKDQPSVVAPATE
ncbi:MAG: dicarboxylate/amino acid:cation symporter, partial [Pirellulales bacterium]|nr:dicarboxylate/amino acid:cation symporter [Pirellulales bacterium]